MYEYEYLCDVSVSYGQCVSSAELMFVISTSGSMDPYYMPRVVEFITNMTSSLPVNIRQIRIGVMTYADQSRLDIALGAFRSKSDIVTALQNLQYHGGRYLHFYMSLSLINNFIKFVLESSGTLISQDWTSHSGHSAASQILSLHSRTCNTMAAGTYTLYWVHLSTYQ